jgi:hypothetical protein
VFLTDLFDEMKQKGMKQKDIDRMTIAELISKMKAWINKKATKPMKV